MVGGRLARRGDLRGDKERHRETPVTAGFVEASWEQRECFLLNSSAFPATQIASDAPGGPFPPSLWEKLPGKTAADPQGDETSTLLL